MISEDCSQRSLPHGSIVHFRLRWVVASAVVACTFLNADAQPKDVMHASPQDVFEVFRVATKRRDWRSSLACMTSEARAVAIVEVYTTCVIKSDKADVSAVFTKYHLVPGEIDLEFTKRSKQKKGVAANENIHKDGPEQVLNPKDNAKIGNRNEQPVQPRKEVYSNTPPAQASALDEMLLYEVLTLHIGNPTEFFIDAKNAITDSSSPRIEQLENLVIREHSAVGSVRMAASSETLINGGLLVPTERIFNEQMRFRRIDGSWYVDR